MRLAPFLAIFGVVFAVLAVVAGPALANALFEPYSLMTFQGMIPPTPQNNDGWYMLFDSEGASSDKQVLTSARDFNLSSSSGAGLWFSFEMEYNDQVNVTLHTSKGKTINLGFMRAVTGEWFPISTPSDRIDFWADVPEYNKAGEEFADVGSQLVGGGKVFIRYARHHVTEQTGIEVRLGGSDDYVIVLQGVDDVIDGAIISASALIPVTAYNTNRAYFNSTGTSPTVGVTDLPAYISEVIGTLIKIFNVTLAVIGVAFSLFKIFVIDHGVTTFLLLEVGGLFFYMNKYKSRRGGIFEAFRHWLGMNDKIMHAVYEFSGWAVSMLSRVISSLSAAVNAGVALGGNLITIGITLLRAIL
jgi:hypothetical protein